MSRAARERKQARAARSADGAARAAAARSWQERGPLIAAVVAFLVYAPSLAGGFLYDDQAVIVLNGSIRDLSALGTVLRYEPARPLLNLTWALNYAASGLTPWPYHLVNVLIHAGNAALAASLFVWMAARLRWNDPGPAALAGALFFAATPMAAETVAYVTSRSTALATLFALGSLRLAAAALVSGSVRAWAGAAGLYLLALSTKEEAAAIPLLLVLLDYFFVAERRTGAMRSRVHVHAAFLASLPLGLAARRLATGAWLPAAEIDRGQYLLTQLAAFPLYLARLILPLDPALYRGHEPAGWPPGLATVAGVFATAALGIFAVRERARRPEWAFAIAALAAGLLPSSSFVPLREMVVDHRAYLGSFGVAFAMGALLWRLGRWRLVLPVIALLAARAVHYEWILADPVRGWQDAVQRAPRSADAASALGEAYAARKDPRAEEAFARATVLNPRNSRYWANLGLYYSENGRLPEAAKALRRAVDEAPRDAAVRDYLGLILQALGRDDEAIAEFEAAMAAEPRFAQAYINLADVLRRRGQVDRARSLLDQASRLPIEPADAEAIVRLQRQLP